MSPHLSLRKPYAVVAFIACFGWMFFFFRSEFFELQDIEVQASGGVVNSADILPIVLNILDEQSARPWSKRQIHFLPKQKLEEGIQAALYAEKVEIGDTRNNILRLSISFGSRFLYTTQNGEDFQTCTVARPAGIPLTDSAVMSAARKHYLAKDFTTQAIDGIVYVRKATTTLEVPYIKRLLELGKVLDDHQLPYAHIEELDGKDVSIQLDRTSEVMISLEQPITDQVERVQSILRDKDYKNRRPSQIDVRIPGRAYLR